MLLFFVSLLCSIIFVATANADVTIEGEPTPYRANIGDTVHISFKKSLAIGENFVRWEIVSGSGVFVNASVDSTGFIPSTNSVVLRAETRLVPIYEISETATKLYFDQNSAKIPNDSYGLRMYFQAGASSNYMFSCTFNQRIMGLNYFGTDSTYTNVQPRTTGDSYGRNFYFTAQPNSKNYLFFYIANSSAFVQTLRDSTIVSVRPIFTLDVSASEGGYAQVDSLGTLASSFNRAPANQSSYIYAFPDPDYNFDHWEVVSGNCTISDKKNSNTTAVIRQGDCKVKAVFSQGSVYAITKTPTEYNFTDNVYAKRVSSGKNGVRFTFTAPSSGSYTIIMSNSRFQSPLEYIRHASADFSTVTDSTRFTGTLSKTLNLTVGQTVYITLANTIQKDNPFYINYGTQSYKLTLTPDLNGKTIPANGYDTAFVDTKYSISAQGNAGYHFSDWEIVSGTPVIDDKNQPNTFVTISGNVELKAHFKQSSIYKLSEKKQKFNFKKNYYNESTRSAIRFSWTSPDSASFALRVAPVDSVYVIIRDYGTDSTFSKIVSTVMANSASNLNFANTPNTTHYFTIQDTSSGIPDKSFNAWISAPFLLNITASKGGSVNPSGTQSTKINEKTILTAWAHGGYNFDSWELVEGNANLSTTTEARSILTTTDSLCTVRAVFKEDAQAKPSLSISQFELANYPEICANVSVTDLHSGHSFQGLTPDDLVLTQDGQVVPTQISTINNVTGISVVIVVDESASMTANNAMDNAKASIKAFINGMTPYDRSAIVGFYGGTGTTIHQTMTSNKTLLLQAVDSLKAYGGTNIIAGACAGLGQIVNETNPTMVIVFSDGGNDSDDNRILDSAVSLAQSKKTIIHTIGVGTTNTMPLEPLAKRTGGIYTYANNASELAGIYEAMRDNSLSQYVVCYESPDTLQNGDTHNVIISMAFNKITTKDSFQWNENSLPPRVSLTDATWNLIKNSQQANSAITISAYITTSLQIKNANVFLRNSSTVNTQFTSYAMRHVRDSLWEYTVPANQAVAPGIDFYIAATDTAGQQGKSPRIQTPAMEPYTIFIGNDIPVIDSFTIACEDSTSELKTFSFRMSDNNGIHSAVLYYSGLNAYIYQTHPFSYTIENDTWTTKVPMNITEYTGFRYYLRVTDALGASVRYPETGFLTTDACEVKEVIPEPEDSSIVDSIPKDSNMVPSDTNTVPEDSLAPSPRDSIVYSLIADTAEIYDKDLDGRADYVRVHFKEERSDNMSGVDSIFWNSNRGEWRYVPTGKMKQNRSDGKWFEGYINKPYKYGLTKADSAHPPFLAFNTVYSEELENVRLLDRVGAVPSKATKFPGKVGLKEYMDPNSETPPDTLVIWMSEPIRNVGNEKGWENLFRYSESCEDTASLPLNLKGTPIIRDNGQQWTIFLDGYFLKEGACLFTDPEASYEDQAGNPLGRGGVKVEGEDGKIYLSEVRPLQAISGIGETPQWIPPEGAGWELLPDSISAISVKSSMPYTAEVYIFSAIATYVTQFKQKFGYDGEMDQSIRGNSGDLFKQGYLHWNNRSEKGRKVGTGIYIWKIFFKFEDGHKETRIVKTGVYRRGSRK